MAAPGQGPAPLLQALQSIARALPGLFSDRIELLSLELQRAGLALARIAALVVVVAILGVTAWLLLWAGIVAALVAAGLPLPLALLVVVMVNLLAAWGSVRMIMSQLPSVGLPATRRHLTLSPSPQPRPVPAAPAAVPSHPSPARTTAP